jgi:hypothetical protein
MSHKIPVAKVGPPPLLQRCFVVVFFAWLVLRDKVLTTHNLQKRNWPCNLICSLYSCIHETTTHILTECNYTEALWNIVASTFGLNIYRRVAQKNGLVQLHVVAQEETSLTGSILFSF